MVFTLEYTIFPTSVNWVWAAVTQILWSKISLQLMLNLTPKQVGHEMYLWKNVYAVQMFLELEGFLKTDELSSH